MPGRHTPQPRTPDGRYTHTDTVGVDPARLNTIANQTPPPAAPDEPVIAPALADRLCAELVEPPARFLVSAAGDRVFVQVAAPVDGTGGGCLDCDTNTNGPGFAVVDAHTGDITGAGGDQCGGCGAIGAGWVRSDVVEVTDSDPTAVRGTIEDLVDEVTGEAARRADAAGPAVAAAADQVLDALSEADTFEELLELGLPDTPDGAGGVFYDPASGEFGCWLPGITVDDGRDVEWSATVRSDADLTAARAAALRDAATADNWVVRRNVAANPAASPDTLTRLAADEDANVRAAAAANPNLPPELLTVVAADPNVFVRAHVAKNPAAPTELLTRLAADPHPDVRAVAVANPNLPAAGRAAAGLLAD